MVIDTSAVIAILFGEPDQRRYDEAIAAAPVRLVSAVTRVELTFVVEGRKREEARARLERFFQLTGAEIVSVTPNHAEIAIEALRRFGKGRHRAGLNIGDCFPTLSPPRPTSRSSSRATTSSTPTSGRLSLFPDSAKATVSLRRRGGGALRRSRRSGSRRRRGRRGARVLAFRAHTSVSINSRLHAASAASVRIVDVGLTPPSVIVAALQIERPVVGPKPRFAPNAVVCRIAVSSDDMARVHSMANNAAMRSRTSSSSAVGAGAIRCTWRFRHDTLRI